jgi:poly(3-hydroxyalkanoate) synthetase
MGGLTALAALLHIPELARALVMIASPWDFHASEDNRWFQHPYNRDFLRQLFTRFDLVPGSLIHSMLYAGDPVSTYAKYARFVELEEGSDEYHLFIAREQWLHDPVPLAPAIAAMCMIDWAIDNAPQQQSWRVFDEVVQPGQLSCPTLIASAQHDKLIPATSCRTLLEIIPHRETITPQTGHLGLVAGLKAEKECWNPLVKWVHEL